VAAKSGQFIAVEAGKGQFLRVNQRNLAEQRIVKNVITGASGLGTSAKENVAPVMTSESASSLPRAGKSHTLQVSLLATAFNIYTILVVVPWRNVTEMGATRYALIIMITKIVKMYFIPFFYRV